MNNVFSVYLIPDDFTPFDIKVSATMFDGPDDQIVAASTLYLSRDEARDLMRRLADAIKAAPDKSFFEKHLV